MPASQSRSPAPLFVTESQPIASSSVATPSVATPQRTRLAPSPTGALHLGNARTFVINWLIARQQNWRIVLRIDDLDGPRVKRGADRDAIEVLQWLGLDWDEGPFYQSHSIETYRAALRELARDGAIYPCRCTRTQIQMATLSAPHAGEHELRYPGTCRPVERASLDFDAVMSACDRDGTLPSREISETNYRQDSTSDQADSSAPAWRLSVPVGAQTFDDEFCGKQSANVAAEVGDFLVATKQGLPSYQLAVVLDDAAQQINCIVRGDDLLQSTARQQLVKLALKVHAPDVGMPCRYWHLPLIIGADGRRLAKRHGDTRVAFYRQRGVRPERILGLLAEWSGVGPRQELSLDEFASRFTLAAMPRRPAVFQAADDAWLLRR